MPSMPADGIVAEWEETNPLRCVPCGGERCGCGEVVLVVNTMSCQEMIGLVGGRSGLVAGWYVSYDMR